MNEALERIFLIIQRHYKRHSGSSSYVIGINGFDCCGKTTFTRRLSQHFTSHNIENQIIDIDEFNDPVIEAEVYSTFVSGKWDKTMSEKYYASIINYDDANRAVDAAKKEAYGLVMLEGIFLFKPQLNAVFDLRIYLDIEILVANERFSKRRAKKDARPFEILEDIWLPAHRKYVAEVLPSELCDLAIDNNDDANPVIIRNNCCI